MASSLPNSFQKGSGGVPASIDEAEEALIACHELWWRTPGGGRWPFASDGPWHLIRPESGDIVGEASTTVLDTGKRLIDVIKVDTAKRVRAPLAAAEVAERDRVTQWLDLLPDPADRAIVHQATLAMWRGESRPPWKEIKRALGWRRTVPALLMRYRTALAHIVCAINGWPSRRVKVLAESHRRHAKWAASDVPALDIAALDPENDAVGE